MSDSTRYYVWSFLTVLCHVAGLAQQHHTVWVQSQSRCIINGLYVMELNTTDHALCMFPTVLTLIFDSFSTFSTFAYNNFSKLIFSVLKT